MVMGTIGNPVALGRAVRRHDGRRMRVASVHTAQRRA